MSKARSPRWLCSITYGISGMPLVSSPEGNRPPGPRGSALAVSWPRTPRRRTRCTSSAAGGGRRLAAGVAQEEHEAGLSALTVRRFFDFSPLGETRKHLLVPQLDPHRLL